MKEINRSKLNEEGRLEKLLEGDISTIRDDLLVIGRQVGTDYGGWIDLLSLNREGDLVIVELKRDKTPREVTAQTLDYASWINDLSNDRITEIANKYLGDKGPLEEAFKRKFGEDLPEILNESHEMLIVASEIDSNSERIIKYLSDSYGVRINAATFQYFRDSDGKELLARVFLIEPSEVEQRNKTKTISKRSPNLTYEELRQTAVNNDVGEIYDRLVQGLKQHFVTGTTRSTIAFQYAAKESKQVIISLVPSESTSSKGLRFQLYRDRLLHYLGISTGRLSEILPSQSEECEPWKGSPVMIVGFFKDGSQVDNFLKGLNAVPKT
jgi:hypothetical protein